MEIIRMVCIFMLGGSITSCIDVMVERVPQKQSFITGRSSCVICNKQLYWYDIIPIFSWINLKGKCRFCKQKITKRVLYVEIIGGIIALISYCHHFELFDSLFFIVMSIILVVISLIDYQSLIIPNECILFCFVLILLSFFIYEIPFLERGISFFIISLPMYLMNQFIEDSFGGGDIKLIAVFGLMLGLLKTIVAFCVAILVATLYVLLKGKTNLKEHIAFGPFLSLGIIIAFIYGQNIIDYYLWLTFF